MPPSNVLVAQITATSSQQRVSMLIEQFEFCNFFCHDLKKRDLKL